MRKIDKLMIVHSTDDDNFTLLVFEFVGMKIGNNVFLMKSCRATQRFVYVPYPDREGIFKVYSITTFAADYIQEIDSSNMTSKELTELFNAGI